MNQSINQSQLFVILQIDNH